MVELDTNVTSGERVGPSMGAFEIKFRSLSNRLGSGTSSCGLGTISVGISRLCRWGSCDDVVDDVDEFATRFTFVGVNSGGSLRLITLLVEEDGGGTDRGGGDSRVVLLASKTLLLRFVSSPSSYSSSTAVSYVVIRSRFINMKLVPGGSSDLERFMSGISNGIAGVR